MKGRLKINMIPERMNPYERLACIHNLIKENKQLESENAKLREHKNHYQDKWTFSEVKIAKQAKVVEAARGIPKIYKVDFGINCTGCSGGHWKNFPYDGKMKHEKDCVVLKFDKALYELD